MSWRWQTPARLTAIVHALRVNRLALPSHGANAHARMLDWVRENVVERELVLLRDALLHHGRPWLSSHEDPRVLFGRMQTEDLAGLMRASARLTVLFAQAAMYPNEVLKRELGFELASWEPLLPSSRRMQLAALLLPALPEELSLSSLLWMYEIKRTESALKQIPGRWEYIVRSRITQMSGHSITQTVLQDIGEGGKAFEVDGVLGAGKIENLQDERANPLLFVHIQRIVGPPKQSVDSLLEKSDIMKRRFGLVPIVAILYVPDLQSQGPIQYALNAGDVDGVGFASDEITSIDDALLAALKIAAPHIIGGNKRIAAPLPPGKVGEQGKLFKS
jgi:hypothetical protein